MWNKGSKSQMYFHDLSCVSKVEMQEERIGSRIVWPLDTLKKRSQHLSIWVCLRQGTHWYL